MFSPPPNKRLGCELLTLVRIFVVALIAFGIYELSTQSPIDYLKFYGAIAISAIILFVASPWFRVVQGRYSSVAMVLALVLCGCISIFLEVREQPTNYAVLFSTLFTIVSFLFVISPWSKNIRRRFPPLFIVLFSIYGGVATFLLLLSRPIDSREVLLPTITFAVVWLFLFLQYLRRPRNS